MADDAEVIDITYALLAGAADRARKWPYMSYQRHDGVMVIERCWPRMVDVVLPEVSLPVHLLELFAAPLPSPLPPREDLQYAVLGIPLAAQVMDAKPRGLTRTWAAKLWLWGPAGARIVFADGG